MDALSEKLSKDGMPVQPVQESAGKQRRVCTLVGLYVPKCTVNSPDPFGNC